MVPNSRNELETWSLRILIIYSLPFFFFFDILTFLCDLKGILFVGSALDSTTLVQQWGSLLSREGFDKSLSGVKTEKGYSSYSCISCSAVKWKECEYSFHSSEKPLFEPQSLGHCLSLHCSGYRPAAAGELLKARTRKSRLF